MTRARIVAALIDIRIAATIAGAICGVLVTLLGVNATSGSSGATRPVATAASQVVRPQSRPKPARNTTIPIAAQNAILRFAETAIPRRNLGEAWRLAAPSLRNANGGTRREWMRGAIAVTPWPRGYTFRVVAEQTISITQRRVAVILAAAGQKHRRVAQAAYEVVVVLERGRWLVAYCAPFDAQLARAQERP